MKSSVFGRKIREIRKSNNKTLKEVSNHLNISVPYLSDVEKGNRHPLNYAMIESFSNLFGVNPLELHRLAGLSRGFVLTPNVTLKGAEFGAALVRNWAKYTDSDFEKFLELVRSLPER